MKFNALLIGMAVLLSSPVLRADSPFELLHSKTHTDRVTLAFQPAGFQGDGDLPAPSGTLIYLQHPLAELPAIATTPEIDPSRITLNPVQVGGYHALHVVLDGVQEPLTIQLDFPVSASKAALKPLSQDEKAQASSLFINGADANYRSVDSVGKAILPIMPEPPGDHRLEFLADQRLYSLDYSALGIPSLEPSKLSILHHGSAVAFTTENAAENHVLIFAPQNSSNTSETDSFFVSENEITPSPVMTTRSAFSSLSPQSQEVSQTITNDYDPNLIYERGSILPNGERFVAWRARNGETHTETVVFDDLLTTIDVSLSASLLGYTSNSANPDHYADLTLNGVGIPRFSWEDRTQATLNAQVQLPGIPDPAEFTLTHSVDPASPFGGGADFQNLDTFTVTYGAYPRVSADGIKIINLSESGSTRLVTVGNLPAIDSAIVADITDPNNPILLENLSYFNDLSGTTAVEFEDAGSTITYLIQVNGQIESFPQITTTESFSPLPDSAALRVDDIFVRDDVYADELQPLIDSLPNESYSFTPQMAYNVYNHGQSSPEAIRLALADIVSRTPSFVSVPNVTLVGIASFDRKNLLQLERPPQIPVYIEDSFPTGGIEIETSSDFNYSLIQGNDQFPDVQIGRLTVRDEQELTIVVNRALAHASQVQALSQHERLALFVTDNETQFLNEIPYLAQLWENTGLPSARVDIDGTGDTEEIDAILEGPNGGAAFVLYTGHGNENRWASEQVVTNLKVPDFMTENQWPVIASFTCLNGNYAFPGALNRTLSEVWLITPTNGSPYNVAPSSVDGFPQHLLFSQQAMLAFSENHPVNTAGEWMHLSLVSYLTAYPTLDRTARSYGVFGFPGTSMAFKSLTPAISDTWVLHGN